MDDPILKGRRREGEREEGGGGNRKGLRKKWREGEKGQSHTESW